MLHTYYVSLSEKYKTHLGWMLLLHYTLLKSAYFSVRCTHLPSFRCFLQMPVGYRPSQHNGIILPVLLVLPNVLLSPKSVINGLLLYSLYILLSDRLHQGHYLQYGSYVA